jgi:hypothetical protein
MRTFLTIIHALIIVLLTISCRVSSGGDDGRDSGSGNPDETVKADGGDGKEADAEVRNPCAEAKELYLTAIRDKCAELVDCCYCQCELAENSNPDCDCTSWGLLMRDRDVMMCEGGDLNAALNCVNNSDSCINNVKNVVTARCSN